MSVMDKWAQEWERKRDLREDMAKIGVKVREHTDMESRDYERDVEHFYCEKCGTLLGKRRPPLSEHEHRACYEALVQMVHHMRDAMIRHDFIDKQPFDREDDY